MEAASTSPKKRKKRQMLKLGHKKRKTGEKVCGNYTVDQILAVIKEHVRTGKPLRRLIVGTGISYSTIKTKYAEYKKTGNVIKKKQGHPTLFTFSEKFAMKKFLTATVIMGIPRTEEGFNDDLVHYCHQNNKKIPSKKDTIGKTWFSVFKNEEGFVFPSLSEVCRIRNEAANIEQWFEEKKNSILLNNNDELVDSRAHVFFLEDDPIQILVPQDHRIDCLLGYNGEGDLIPSVICHNGTINQDRADKLKPDMYVMSTPNGKINLKSVHLVVLLVTKFQMQRKITGKVVVYLSPFIADSFNFMAWLHCRNNGIIPIVVPRNIYESARTMRKGIFTKVQNKWTAEMKKWKRKKVQPKSQYDAYKAFGRVYKSVNVKEVVRTTFAHLNLSTVKRPPQSKPLVLCTSCQQKMNVLEVLSPMVDLRQPQNDLGNGSTENTTIDRSIWTPQRDGKYYVPSEERLYKLLDAFFK